MTDYKTENAFEEMLERELYSDTGADSRSADAMIYRTGARFGREYGRREVIPSDYVPKKMLDRVVEERDAVCLELGRLREENRNYESYWREQADRKHAELQKLREDVLKESRQQVKKFPILPSRVIRAFPRAIPWSVAELAYGAYSSRYGTDQSLERIAERGGFGPDEMDEFLPDWIERCSEIALLHAHVRTLEEALEFYADNRLYVNIGIRRDLYDDQGNKARAALAARHNYHPMKLRE